MEFLSSVSRPVGEVASKVVQFASLVVLESHVHQGCLPFNYCVAERISPMLQWCGELTYRKRSVYVA